MTLKIEGQLLQSIHKGGLIMTREEIIKDSIAEFSRLQSYMLAADKDSKVYQLMYPRYNELKVLLSSLGVNVTEIDMIKG